MKTQLTNIAAVGIIYRATDPRQVFLEVKDDGHPIKFFRRKLCLIGGNWIGEQAKNDPGPRGTFCREINEELSFDRPTRSGVELSLLGLADNQAFAPLEEQKKPIQEDVVKLGDLLVAITSSAVHFSDFITEYPKSVLDAADPDNKRDGFKTLCSVWHSPLQEPLWESLEYLQGKFGNLSNESATLITSLEEMIRTGTCELHDFAFRQFFQEFELSIENFPMIPGIKTERIDRPGAIYQHYLEKYDVAKKP